METSGWALPLLSLSRSMDDSAAGVEHRRRFAQCVMRSVVHARGAIGQPVVATDELVASVRTITALDECVIAYAERHLPLAWQRIAATVAGFSSHAVPVAYRDRDKRIPALIMYLGGEDGRDPASPSDEVMTTLVAASRHDGALYNAVMANLAQSGDLMSLAIEAVEAA